MPPVTVAALSQVPLLAALAVTLETVRVPCPAFVTATGKLCLGVLLRDRERERIAAELRDRLRGHMQQHGNLLVVGGKR